MGAECSDALKSLPAGRTALKSAGLRATSASAVRTKLCDDHDDATLGIGWGRPGPAKSARQADTSPGRREVLVKVAAVALNHRDKMVIENVRGLPLAFP